MPAKYGSKRSKMDTLIDEGTFNPNPEKVRDPKFRGSEFFDPHDAVQVKYEMLRRVSIDNVSVTDASDEYGVSRQTSTRPGLPDWSRQSRVPADPTRSTTKSWPFCRHG
jgi:hypothetical protein